MAFTPWQPPAPEILELQAINRRIEQLHTELRREKNRRHAADFAGASADAIAHDIEVNIRHLERRLERMHESALKLVRGVPTWPPSSPTWSRPKASAKPRRCASWPNSLCSRMTQRTTVGGARRARSSPLQIGYLDPSPTADQRSRQPPPACRALHVCTGGHSTRAQCESVLQQTRCRRQKTNASRGRGHA